MINQNAILSVPGSSAGKHCHLNQLLRHAGVPHHCSVSADCARRYDLADDKPGARHHYDFAWAVRCAITGVMPARIRQAAGRTFLVVEFPSFQDGETEPVPVSLGIVATATTVQLVLPTELPAAENQPLPVLLVEDDPDLGELIRLWLEQENFKVTHALSGETGLKLLQQDHFEAVVLDVDLPGMDGFEVCRRIKGNPATCRLPVVFCSGRCDLAERVPQLGAAAWVGKPEGLPHLADTLRRVIAG